MLLAATRSGMLKLYDKHAGQKGSEPHVGWFSRLFKSGSKGNGSGPAPADHRAHLAEFVSTRRRVEGFIEPATTMNPVTLLLVAADGEWTRRTVPGEKAARSFADSVGIPIYDVNQSGYPSAMREYNARQRGNR